MQGSVAKTLDSVTEHGKPLAQIMQKKRSIIIPVIASLLLIACAGYWLASKFFFTGGPREYRAQAAAVKEPQFIPGSHLTAVWANDGCDKVTKDELRSSKRGIVPNSVWDGTTIRQFGGRNEVVSVNVVLEAALADAEAIEFNLDTLQGPNHSAIASRKTAKEDVFRYADRNIEIFYVRYLQIRGLSKLGYDPTYDERHVPIRFQLPYSGWKGTSRGTFEERPDANKFYPDIAVPIEAVGKFGVRKGENQSIWIDIYIPKTAAEGLYRGSVEISEQGKRAVSIPVELEVLPYALPDVPSAKTMLYFSADSLYDRYFGKREPNLSQESRASVRYLENVWNAHHLVAHRHKLSLIDQGASGLPGLNKWKQVLSGELFSRGSGYDGPGAGVSSGVYSIGTYGAWNAMWDPKSESAMHSNADKWVQWFESNYPGVEYFLYLQDEPEATDYPQVQRWAEWVKNNPGPGKRLKTLVTSDIVKASQHMPSVDIAFVLWGAAEERRALQLQYQREGRKYYSYNGIRIANGSFMTEDEGVSLRVLGWTQFKHKIDRWFYWESTAYINLVRKGYETDVFEEAQTFGGEPRRDSKFGLTGYNYGNGDGVLFYPGTEKRYSKQSYGLPGPIASLRMKLWRRGIQDVDYLTMASRVDPQAVDALVQRMIPKVLWEVGVTNPLDPSYVHTDISWSVDPDRWEKARRELATIILRGQGK